MTESKNNRSEPAPTPKPVKKKQPAVRWLPTMKQVLYALIPAAAAAVYFFGWRCLALLAVINAAGYLTEYAFTRTWKQPVSSSVFVTSVLFTLALPPTIPFWMAVVGIVVGMAFGKMVFGGYAKNVFNPALVGRAFIYITFPVHMNSSWAEAVPGLLSGGAAAGGFARWSSDALTQATPMRVMSGGQSVSWLQLFKGTTAGCMGETCALLIVLGGLYIVWKKAADYRIVVSGLAGMLAVQSILWKTGVTGAIHPLAALLSGGFMLGLFFFATEPISAPRTVEGKWMYGAFIGIMTVVIRTFSAWSEGMMFAVLLGNMFGPIGDIAIKAYKGRKAKK